MLKFLRKKNVAKKIFYGLSVIIIPAFVIWGSANVMQKNKVPSYAGMIFGQRVSFDDFSNAMSAWKIQLKLQYGEKTNEIIDAFFNPIDATWDRLILLHEAKKQKIKIGDKEIVDTITKLPFLRENGQFSPQAYNLFLKYSLDVPARYFEEQLRQNIAMSKIFEQITKDISVPDEEIKQAYKNENEQTRVKYACFTPKTYKDSVTVTDEEINNFYENSKEEFRVPPQINVSYSSVDFDDKTGQPAKDAAQEKIKKVQTLAQHKPLDEIAKELNLKYQETGFFGLADPIPTLGWMPQINPVLFDLALNQTSQIIQLDRGVFLFKITGKKDAYLPDLKETREKVIDLLKDKKAREIARQKAQEFIAALAPKTTGASSIIDFEKIAQDKKLEIKETPLFSREAYIPELGMAQQLKEAAFQLKKDEIAKEPVELEQGFYCIQSVETIGVDQEKFLKEKDDFKEKLISQKKNNVFSDYFNKLKKQAHLINYIDDNLAKKNKRF